MPHARLLAMKALLVVLAPVALAASGCADLRDLMTLQGGLVREFQHSDVTVNVTGGTHLMVVFQNSSFASLPDAERAAFAHRVAVFVRDHYGGYGRLHSVGVGFASRTAVGPVSYTNSAMPYTFAVGELGPPSDTSHHND
jgi:hypothetical protein